jgi:hypothetical protein
MKRLFSIALIACSFVLGMGSMDAQNLSAQDERPEVIAKSIVADLDANLDLNGDQERALFRAYTAHQSNMKKHVIGKDSSDPAVRQQKEKFDKVLKSSVQKSLSDAQYKKWLSMQDQ